MWSRWKQEAQTGTTEEESELESPREMGRGGGLLMAKDPRPTKSELGKQVSKRCPSRKILIVLLSQVLERKQSRPTEKVVFPRLRGQRLTGVTLRPRHLFSLVGVGTM